MLGQNAGKHLKCQHSVSLRERMFDLTEVSEGRDHFKPIRSTFSNWSGGYAGVFISHHHTSQGSSAVWYTDCTGMHGRCFLPGRWETMQTKTHTTYVNTMVRKMCQFVLFVLNGQKQVTSSDPSFGSTHFHRNSLCWREKQAVGQPAGIFACKQAKWVSQI